MSLQNWNRRPLCLALLGIAVVWGAVRWQYRGPSPKPASAPLADFSAERALVVLRRVLGDQKPHPAGSQENAAVRQRLVGELEQLGLSVAVQSTILPQRDGLQLHNVLASLPNQVENGRPLMLTTHFDSVAVGPGAGDSGSGVAALIECARALLQHPPANRPIYFLFTDGEELGMLGAQAFVDQHPLAKQKPFVLNFDARGSRGPSLLYETHGGNLPLIRAVAERLPRPVITGSSFVTVYRQIPNNTDFTIFRRAGCQGLNFAFVDGAHRYHTPQDTIENLDRRSVQHHGEYALQLARALAPIDLDHLTSTEDAVFFDVLGLRVFWHPEKWSVPLALTVLVAFLIANRRSFADRSDCRAAGRTVLVVLIAAIGAAAFGLGFSRLLDFAGLLTRRYVPFSELIIGAYWCAAAMFTWGMAGGLLQAVAPRNVWSSVWLGWTIAALALAWFVPGLSYFILLPSALATTLSLTSGDRQWLAAIASVISAILLVPVLHLLGIVLGPWPGVVLCPLFVLALSPLLPLLTGMKPNGAELE